MLLRPSLPPGERFGLLAEFASAGDLYRACEGVRDAGYTRWDAHAPFPVHGLERAMGLRASPLPWFVLVLALAGAAAGISLQGWVSTVGAPLVVDEFQLLQLTVFASMCILALSLGVVWGYGGILCFGQSAFFGLGAYTYAVTAVNLGESTLAIVLAIVLPAVFAALLGYFMFYGRLSDVYLGVITLSVTLSRLR